MLASAFLLLLNGAFLSLRLGAGSGSFPRPLPAKEERRCVERWMRAISKPETRSSNITCVLWHTS